MGRLKGRGLGSRLAAPSPRLRVVEAAPVSRDADRRARQHWRAWYGTAAWRALSWEVRLAAGFQCAMCGVVDGRPRMTVADHRVPHRGDRGRFFDRGNLQCLCKGCHDGAKQADDRSRH